MTQHSIKLTGLALVLAFAGAAAPAQAATHDGRWSVLVVTEQGNCDQAYRYEVAVTNGRIRYAGPEKVDFSGSVAANGAVKVNIRLGEQGANGAGKLSASSGTGTWKGTGNSGSCAGRWEAERR
ncbi:MAG: hypothetical protein KIT76_14830 [Pseudolabrys sp.]|nr:hypothetical protein [Pseudolabrys sp.]